MNKKIRRVSAQIRHLKRQRLKEAAKPPMRENPVRFSRVYLNIGTLLNPDTIRHGVLDDDLDYDSDNEPEAPQSRQEPMATAELSSLQIKIDHVPIKVMDANRSQKFIAIVRNALAECGCTGSWSIKSVDRDKSTRSSQQRRMQYRDFCVCSIVELKGQSGLGIKFVAQTHNDQKCVFFGVLSSPTADIEAVYQQLSEKHSKNKEQKQEEAASRQVAQVGEVYLAKIVEIRTNGVVVAIFPDNPPEYRNAFCPIIDLDTAYISTNEIGNHFRVDQEIMVQATAFDGEQPIVNRRVLLQPSDNFHLTLSGDPSKPKWNMMSFSDSPERMHIFLDMVRHAIERFATEAAWEKAAKSGIIGKVFLEDSSHPSAPAYMVKDLVANGIILKWAEPPFAGKPEYTADTDLRISPLFTILAKNGYICTTKGTINSQPGRDLAYCMMDEGYAVLKRKKPPLPTVSQPVPAPEPIPAPEPTPTPEPAIVELALQPHNNIRASLGGTPKIDETMNNTQERPAAAVERNKVLELMETYQLYEARKNELDTLLNNYEALVAERETLNEWLAKYAAIGDALRLTQLI